MAKLKVVHKWVGLGRVQSFMLIMGRVGLGHFTCGSGQENWIHVQLCGRSLYIVDRRIVMAQGSTVLHHVMKGDEIVRGGDTVCR